jgi:CRISPR-associated protein Cas2
MSNCQFRISQFTILNIQFFMERNFYLLTYDIADNKRRQKIARLCEAVAERVQESVFEAYLTPDELSKLLKKTARRFKDEEDSLRVYLLCAACREKVATFGQGKVTPPPAVVVV